jgi:predicted TIM-barrel fold metal-dependent hydrolase
VNLRVVEAGNRLINDPHFFPLYEAASDLDMPVCPHTGTGSEELDRLFSDPLCAFERNKFNGLSAFHLLLMSGLPDRFPALRWGFIEYSSDWVPYLINDITRRLERRGGRMKERPLQDNRIWVACQTNDDLPQVVRYAGDDHLVIGTDYGHSDSSTEIRALQAFQRDERLPAESRARILHDNAVALYSL